MRMRRNENWNVGGDDVGMILRSEGLVECIKLVASYQYRADQNNQPGLSRECIETAPPAVMDIGRMDMCSVSVPPLPTLGPRDVDGSGNGWMSSVGAAGVSLQRYGGAHAVKGIARSHRGY